MDLSVNSFLDEILKILLYFYHFYYEIDFCHCKNYPRSSDCNYVRALVVNESNRVLIYCSTFTASNAYIEVILCTLQSANIVAAGKVKIQPYSLVLGSCQ